MTEIDEKEDVLSPEEDEESDVRIDEDDSVDDEGEILELTTEQLEALLGHEEEIFSIPDLLEKEMINNRTLYLNEDITLDTINHIIMLIHKYNRDDFEIPVNERIPITLYIDSAGGEIYRGFSLASAIESSTTPVVGILQGTCMSMALIIYLACHHRFASKFSNVLYHTLRAASNTETLIEMENKLQHYKYLQDTLDNYILEKTEIPKKKLKKKRQRNLDWYLTLAEMEKYKIYDALIE